MYLLVVSNESGENSPECISIQLDKIVQLRTSQVLGCFKEAPSFPFYELFTLKHRAK